MAAAEAPPNQPRAIQPPHCQNNAPSHPQCGTAKRSPPPPPPPPLSPLPTQRRRLSSAAVPAPPYGFTCTTSPPRSLTLDGAVKCIYGQLHPLDRMLDRFQSLEHLSIANIGVSSLEKFPRLRNLQRLILSDNWISGGLEFLVGAGLESLRDLDLSNNRIQTLEDLAPLARLRLVSLDLYECPVTRVADYRVRVFALISSLKYLDKLDSDGNKRPESDDEDFDEDNMGSGSMKLMQLG